MLHELNLYKNHCTKSTSEKNLRSQDFFTVHLNWMLNVYDKITAMEIKTIDLPSDVCPL